MTKSNLYVLVFASICCMAVVLGTNAFRNLATPTEAQASVSAESQASVSAESQLPIIMLDKPWHAFSEEERAQTLRQAFGPDASASEIDSFDEAMAQMHERIKLIAADNEFLTLFQGNTTEAINYVPTMTYGEANAFRMNSFVDRETRIEAQKAFQWYLNKQWDDFNASAFEECRCIGLELCEKCSIPMIDDVMEGRASFRSNGEIVWNAR